MSQSIVIKKGDELLQDVEVRTPNTNINKNIPVKYPNVQLGSGLLQQQYQDGDEGFVTPTPARKTSDDEGGGGGSGNAGVIMLHITSEPIEDSSYVKLVLDHTWQEIWDLIVDGYVLSIPYTFVDPEGSSMYAISGVVTALTYDDNEYTPYMVTCGEYDFLEFQADTADSYPYRTERL